MYNAREPFGIFLFRWRFNFKKIIYVSWRIRADCYSIDSFLVFSSDWKYFSHLIRLTFSYCSCILRTYTLARKSLLFAKWIHHQTVLCQQQNASLKDVTISHSTTLVATSKAMENNTVVYELQICVRWNLEVKVAVYILKLFVKGGQKGFLAACAWLSRDMARIEWIKILRKVARQNTWKYSVKSRKPEIKRAPKLLFLFPRSARRRIV